ncbi:MAG: hypothetical protein K9K82_08365 [Desulfobacteraceae bacterium]|nr:hypothetical protein [Desulfobacteraceae bacterium]
MASLWNNCKKNAQPGIPVVLVACLVVLVLFCHNARASLQEALDWGGHLRVRAETSDPENNSRLDILEKERLYDIGFEFRSKNSLDLSNAYRFDLHYEMIGTAGDTNEANTTFFDRYPGARRFLFSSGNADDRRLMDLTHIITDDNDYRIYHRIDRLALTYRRDWATLRIGRQALTWGNGFLFNPMDMFNPFSPTDIERDYKVGDDMITFQKYTSAGEVQMLYAPRRDPATGNVAWDQSSAAAKYHRYVGGLEMDLMAGIHYEDFVTGLGLVGYIGGAAWRMDTTYTWLKDSKQRNGFAAFCANLDYSWNWWGKNMYGWIEYYYTGLGTDDYEKAFADEDIMERILRGERYTLGRSYLDTQLRVELHPLVNFNLTLIANTQDPSGLIQPHLAWDAKQNFQITCGANLYWGGPDTEFAGFDLPGLPVEQAPADSIYVWASFYY